jgi:RNA polymerase sigma factor (sigma-70 family)
MAADALADEQEEVEDADLIRESVLDPERFAVLFDRHAERIHRFVARRLGTQVADDTLADTFLVAFRRRDDYDTAQRHALPWLYGIATNLIAKHRRGEERYLRALRRTGADPLPEPMADAVVDRMAAQAHERSLAGALASLTAGDRDVLLLLAWGDLTYEEIAAALAIPLGTVRSRLHRARRKLRHRLGDEYPLTRPLED